MIPFPAIEAAIRRDPGRRGLSSARWQGQLLAEGHFERAARHLVAELPNRIAATIVTGFVVADAQPPAPETDGPPGAVYLAEALAASGADVELLTDAPHLELLRLVEREQAEPPWFRVREFPPLRAGAELDDWLDTYLAARQAAAPSVWLIAIERAGPSHTTESAMRGALDPIAARESFLQAVPVEHRDRMHNMRGQIIEPWTAPAHRLFERAAERGLPIRTLGIADGGNEIGCGAIPWEVLCKVVASPRIAETACRIPCDDLLLAGVSNWGAYALAETLRALTRRRDDNPSGSAERLAAQRRLIERMVEVGALDGVTRRAEPTVDGLSLDNALAPLAEMQQMLTNSR